jgi:hypothetical protein
LIAVWVGATALAGQQLTPPGPASRVTERYELYAPDEATLARATEDLDYAAHAFLRYFGEAPPQIAVVVVGAPADLQRADFAALRARQLRVLPWVVEPAAPGGEALPVQRLGLEGARPLSHEAGHVFLMAWADAKLGRRPAAGGAARDSARTGPLNYGDPSLPDWLDEAVATLCEFPVLQSQRRQLMRARLAERIPLPELFTMEHPVLAEMRGLVEQARTEAAAGGQPSRMMRIQLPAAQSPRAVIFYGETLTLSEFLVEREGPTVIGRVVRDVLAGKSAADALRAVVRSVPSDPAELERAWVAWLGGT